MKEFIKKFVKNRDDVGFFIMGLALLALAAALVVVAAVTFVHGAAEPSRYAQLLLPSIVFSVFGGLYLYLVIRHPSRRPPSDG